MIKHYKISYYIQNFSKNEIACYSIACEDGKSVIIVELHVQCNFIFLLCSLKKVFPEKTTSISWSKKLCRLKKPQIKQILVKQI